MPTYVSISDAEVAPEAPVTTSLMTRLRDNALAYLGAPSGTSALFKQTSAPLGWTKQTTHNDKVPRIVSGTPGTGGSVAFSTLFGRTTTDPFTITQPTLPSLAFVNSGIAASSSNPSIALNNVGVQTGGTGINVPATGGAGSGDIVSTPDITVYSQGLAASGGSGTAISPGIDMRVAYVDFIIAAKD